MRVIVGTTVYREGAYVLDKFMLNQQAVQREYPSCELVLATNEIDLVDELERGEAGLEVRRGVITAGAAEVAVRGQLAGEAAAAKARHGAPSGPRISGGGALPAPGGGVGRESTPPRPRPPDGAAAGYG